MDPSNPYVLGIDGGGTKTAAVILDRQGRLLGTAEGGPSTYGVVPLEVTRASIRVAVDSAADSAGCPGQGFAAAFLGLGNVVSELDRAAVRELAAGLGPAPADRIGVDHDIRVALAGGLSGRPGLVMIAGTGTSCYGVNAAGDSWRAGGWGPLIDDEGSSYWLGIQAMRAAVLAFDGRGQPTQLQGLVSQRLTLREMDELMNRLYAAEMTRTEIAALAPLVFQAAAQGDPVAAELIRKGCAAMAACAEAVATRLGLEQQPSQLAIVGGLTNAGDALLQPFTESVRARLPLCAIQPPELPPALGAALLALQITGQALDENILASVRETARAHHLIR